MPEILTDVSECVDAVLRRVKPRIVLAPLRCAMTLTPRQYVARHVRVVGAGSASGSSGASWCWRSRQRAEGARQRLRAERPVRAALRRVPRAGLRLVLLR